VVASFMVFLLGLDQQGVSVIGQIPQSLPPLAGLPLFDLDFIAQLSTGAFAVAAIGLVETTAISRSIATQTGQRLDSNQEFVGQGLANIAVGLFSGYPVAGSFSRSAVNYRAGAKTSVSAIISGILVLLGMFTLAPLAVYLPRAALAGVLIVTAYGMIDRKEIGRIMRGAKADAVIMIVTFLGTLFLHLEFAVLAGIFLSFAVYIMKTSVPRVAPVVPDQNFKHFVHQADKPYCPQLGLLDIQGDLYFGAVNHVEKVILQHASVHSTQRYLLLRMHNVNQCDFSGIHMLESVVKTYRDRGGDVYFVRVRDSVLDLMKTTGFYDHLGSDHFLDEDTALEYLFYRVLDPSICIYESDVRVFRECQKLARPDYAVEIPLIDIPAQNVKEIRSDHLWERLHQKEPLLVIDVREPREYRNGHIPEAQLIPLPRLLSNSDELPPDKPIVLVCQSGRRSTRAAQFLMSKGCQNVQVLQGGMLEWRTQGLLKAVET
jgi:SulP family sulfate permease